VNTDQELPRIALQRQPSEAERARRAIADACRGLGRDTVATAQLLASELFTNALHHGEGDIVMGVQRLPGELRVDMADRSPAHPRVKPMNLDDVRGRGMMILEALAVRWGVDPLPDGQGKVVWFVLRTAD
jgi:anti-sigma regulatory factor (Ser/Thr protein kinase)